MVVDMGYWTRVFKKIIILIFSIICVYLAFKLAVFYMPFLIAFVIALMIEPIIKFTMKKLKFTRKLSSIIVLVFVSLTILGLLIWGITSLISEASNLLKGLNEYFERFSTQVQQIISSIDFKRLQIPNDVTKVIENSTSDFLGTLSNWVKNILTAIMNAVTSIPIVGIYFVVTILSLYFICTDKIYMLDQLEHHLPQTWVKKLGVHLRELIKTLGCYLKAQSILIIISFVISLIRAIYFLFYGFKYKISIIISIRNMFC